MLTPNSHIPELGSGIYSIPDISKILGLPKSQIRYWLREFWNGKLGESKSVKYSWGERKSKAVNFYTLIEFYVYYQLRNHGISSGKILKAHHAISEALKTSYPFATSQILTDGKSILFSPDINSIICADKTLQINLKEIIEPFCKKIDFSDTLLAQKFYPLGKRKSIVIDPKNQFGQPVIKGTNILAETISNMKNAGESVALISKLYEINKTQIKDALAYFNTAA